MTRFIGKELTEEGNWTYFPEVRATSIRGLKTAATRADYVCLAVTDLREGEPNFWMLKTRRGWERFDHLEEMLAWSKKELS